jgi:Type VII secretion system ESX-1, transport TM domain B
MATKKDLVEAYSFSRRRLVTAFLSGAPGGREVEPSRPGRTVVGGLALAVLLIAGAAIASVLASRTEEDWNKVGLVVSREEAAPYVILDDSEDPTLIPVINITSAQLILGVERAEPTYVSQDVIEDQTPGDPIGIAGAPQTLPRPKQFIESGWTACTDTGIGITTAVSDDPMASISQDLGVVVKSGDDYYVLATSSDDDDHQRTYRYPLPVARNPATDPADDLLLALGIEDVRSEATEVPLDWLNLFPAGGALGADSFVFEDGGKLLNEVGYPSEARVGDYIDDGNGPALVLTREGPSAVSDFALEVLKHTLFNHRTQLPNPVEMERPSAVATERTYTDALWPDDLLQQAVGEPCARLVAKVGDVPRVRLAEEPRGAAVPDPTVPADQKTVVMDPGRGAFVLIGEWDDTEGGDAYVIDPRGKTYLLEGPNTLEKLEYDAAEAPVITDSWLKLFPEGVALSTGAALCPPDLPAEAPATPDTCHEPPS